MVYYDLKFAHNTSEDIVVPDNLKGNYNTDLYKIGDQNYQVGYASCPGTTGFNIIRLKDYTPGKPVSINVEALEPGSALVKGDKGRSWMVTARSSVRQRPITSRKTRPQTTVVAT